MLDIWLTTAFPSKTQISTSSFSEENSPYVFKNIILYIVEGADNPIKMEHKFYVSEISNHLEEDIIGYRTNKHCDDEQSTTLPVQKLTVKSVKKQPQSSQPVQEDYTSFFRNYSPDRFYIKYSKGVNDTRKH